MSAPTASQITDAQRIDPAMAQRWIVAGGMAYTIVLATCRDEAEALGAYWIGRNAGRPIYDVGRLRSRIATDEDVERWLQLRDQDRASTQGARR